MLNYHVLYLLISLSNSYIIHYFIIINKLNDIKFLNFLFIYNYYLSFYIYHLMNLLIILQIYYK